MIKVTLGVPVPACGGGDLNALNYWRIWFWSSWEFIYYKQSAVVIDEQVEKKKEIDNSYTF